MAVEISSLNVNSLNEEKTVVIQVTSTSSKDDVYLTASVESEITYTKTNNHKERQQKTCVYERTEEHLFLFSSIHLFGYMLCIW